MKASAFTSYYLLVIGFFLIMSGAYLFIAQPGSRTAIWLLIAGLISQAYFIVFYVWLRKKV
jgi:hypothetical protein